MLFSEPWENSVAGGRRESFSVSTLEGRWGELNLFGTKSQLSRQCFVSWCKRWRLMCCSWLFHECREVKGLEKTLWVPELVTMMCVVMENGGWEQAWLLPAWLTGGNGSYGFALRSDTMKNFLPWAVLYLSPSIYIYRLLKWCSKKTWSFLGPQKKNSRTYFSLDWCCLFIMTLPNPHFLQ